MTKCLRCNIFVRNQMRQMDQRDTNSEGCQDPRVHRWWCRWGSASICCNKSPTNDERLLLGSALTFIRSHGEGIRDGPMGQSGRYASGVMS